MLEAETMLLREKYAGKNWLEFQQHVIENRLETLTLFVKNKLEIRKLASNLTVNNSMRKK
jgi:hypothetical protein